MNGNDYGYEYELAVLLFGLALGFTIAALVLEFILERRDR